MEPNRSGVQQTLDRWKQAIRDGDSETPAGLVTEDAEFWTHGLPPPSGRNALRGSLAPLFSKYQAEQPFECQALPVSSDPALMRDIETSRLTPRGGGEAVERRQPEFSIIRRVDDGRWLFARGITNSPP